MHAVPRFQEKVSSGSCRILCKSWSVWIPQWFCLGYCTAAGVWHGLNFLWLTSKEDTRIHQAVCKLAFVGQTLSQNAWQGACRTATFVNDRAHELFPHEKAHELAPVSYAKVSELVEAIRKATGTPGQSVPYRDFHEMEWILLDRPGKEVGLSSEFVSAQTEWADRSAES